LHLLVYLESFPSCSVLTAIGQGVINKLVFAMVVLFEFGSLLFDQLLIDGASEHFFFFVLHLFAVHVILEIRALSKLGGRLLLIGVLVRRKLQNGGVCISVKDLGYLTDLVRLLND